MKLIILAAGQGTRLRPHTDNVPKCMVPIRGRPLIHWLLDIAQGMDIRDVIVIGGYRHEALSSLPVKLIVNNAFESTNMVYSLDCARDDLVGDAIITYADIVYEPRVLRTVMDVQHSSTIAVDRGWLEFWRARFVDPLSDAESLRIDPEGRISEVGGELTELQAAQGQFMGLMKFTSDGLAGLCRAMDEFRDGREYRGRTFDNMFMTDLLQSIIDDGEPIWPAWTDRGWFEVDTASDLALAEKMLRITTPYSPGNFEIHDVFVKMDGSA